MLNIILRNSSEVIFYLCIKIYLSHLKKIFKCYIFFIDSISSIQVTSGSSSQQSARKANNSSEVEVLSEKFSFVTSLIREETTESTTSSSSKFLMN